MVCIREVQRDLKESSMQIMLDKISAHGLSGSFAHVGGEIRGPNDSLVIFRGMQSYNADSIKSLEGYDIAWVAEAQTLSQRSLDLLRPTIRKPESELWFDWNPESEEDPIDIFLRGKDAPTDAIVRRVNWSDNPWFPEVLRKDMDRDRKANPAQAGHIWDGDYQQAPKGAYFADLLAAMRLEGRLGRVPADPVLETHVGFDLGNGPNMALIFTQWVGREVRIVETLQGDDQAASEGWPWYIRAMRSKSYCYGDLILPHDARTRQRSTGKGDEEALIAAGFRTRVVERMDPGERVKLVQRYLPLTWIDEEKCRDGIRSWKAYRCDYDEKLKIDRGPLHDWSSHFASALGHVYQAYEEPRIKQKTKAHQPTSWMS